MYTTPNKCVWKLPTSTQLCATWHTDSLDVVVLPSTSAFALPQLLYRWWHQSGLFWMPPHKSMSTKQIKLKKTENSWKEGDDRQPLFGLTSAVLGWVFNCQHMVYKKQCLEHKKIKECNKWHLGKIKWGLYSIPYKYSKFYCLNM
jgi:hypothetical protein